VWLIDSAMKKAQSPLPGSVALAESDGYQPGCNHPTIQKEDYIANFLTTACRFDCRMDEALAIRSVD
jgi:hypothetical protein